MSLGNLITQFSGLQRVRTTLASHQREYTLPAYQRRRHDFLATSLLIALALIYALVSGYFLGVFQQYILLQFLAPCLVLAALALWAMPDRSGVSHHYLERGFFTLIVVNVLWPVYLAIALPGLPWITVSKLVLLVTLLTFGIVVATDRQARSEIGVIFSKAKIIKIALITFICTQFLSLPTAHHLSNSLGATINYQFYWTGVLLMSMLVAAKPGRVDTIAKCILGTAAALCLIAFWENHLQHLPWIGHIPSFVQVSDPVVEQMLSGVRRAADGLYRVQTTYTTSLSCAEFMALAIPFVIHYFLTSQRIWVRAMLFVLYVSIIFTIVVTRSRLGMIGLGIAHLAYPLVIGIRRRGMIRNDLIGPSLIALYPAMLAGFMGALLASRRLYVMFIGGGQHQASNDARESMYHNGIPLILKHPWGYGANEGAGVLGYVDPSGQLTIDSYYLSIGLDYGVIGFVAFYGMLLAAIYLAVRVYLTSKDDAARISAPVAIALGNYFVIKSVLSQSQNQFLMFALVGVSLALNYRFYRAAQKSRQPAAQLAAAHQ